MIDDREKSPSTPGSAGGQRKNHRTHPIAWRDDWSKRHPVTRWSLLDRCEEPPPAPALKLFGRHSLSAQAASKWEKSLKSQLPSDLREKAEWLMAEGRFIEAFAICRFLDAQAKDFNDKRDGEP